MAQEMLVATRKGLFQLAPGGGGWKVTRTSFVGDPVTMVLDDPRDGTLYAALNLGHFGVKLHRSDDRGATWTEVTAPAFPSAAPEKLDATPAGPSVSQVWELVPAGADRAGALWAGTIPGALFHSTDRGESWTLNKALWSRPEREKWFGGGYDDPGIHSVVVDPRDSDHLLLGVSCGGVWESRNGGNDWDVRCEGMFAAYMPPERRNDPDIQDPHRMVACPADPDHLWVQHHNGVFRSTDGAASWSEVGAVKPSVFGFAVAVHPHDPQTAWFVPAIKDECRVPVDGKVVVARTRDGGATFDVLTEGLPADHAYDLVFRHALAVTADGDTLAMGSTTGNLWVGEEGGDRWTAVSRHLPPIYQVAFAVR
jgi:hypothetical protein